MNRKHQIAVCKNCIHQKFTSQNGIICGLTSSIQTFDVQCENFHQTDTIDKSVIENYKGRESLRIDKNIEEVDWDEHKTKMAEIREDGKLRREEIRQEFARKEGMPLEYKSIKSGANWFNIIAVLSIINSVLVFSGAEYNFIFGLGTTTLVDIVFRDFFQVSSFWGLIPQISIAGLFLLFGYYGKKRSKPAYLSGIILYTLDALVFLIWGDFLAIGFHAWAMFSMIKGFRNIKRVKEIEEASIKNNID